MRSGGWQDTGSLRQDMTRNAEWVGGIVEAYDQSDTTLDGAGAAGGPFEIRAREGGSGDIGGAEADCGVEHHADVQSEVCALLFGFGPDGVQWGAGVGGVSRGD